MTLSCPKSTYRVISVLLTVCLLFALIPAPEAHAIAGIDDAALGIGVIGILANSMGYMFSSHGDFKAACAACWNDLSDNLKDSIIDNVQASGMSLNLTALIASTEFSLIWNFIKDYFSGGSVDLSDANKINNCPDKVYPYSVSLSSTSSLTQFIPTSYALAQGDAISWTSNGDTYSYQLYNLTDRSANARIYKNGTLYQSSSYTLSFSGRTYLGVFAFCGYVNNRNSILFGEQYYEGGKYYIGLNPNFRFDYTLGVSQEIPVDFEPYTIPDDAVYDAWKEKCTSAGGITLDVDTTIWQEVFGDIAEDVAMIATQVQTLTDTAVLEAVDDKYYTDPNDETTPRLPFWPGSFSGFGSIWHYVEEWLSSIGGFISLILNVWSSLPYIIVVPVYACVVLILIFGVYRKFIA